MGLTLCVNMLRIRMPAWQISITHSIGCTLLMAGNCPFWKHHTPWRPTRVTRITCYEKLRSSKSDHLAQRSSKVYTSFVSAFPVCPVINQKTFFASNNQNHPSRSKLQVRIEMVEKTRQTENGPHPPPPCVSDGDVQKVSSKYQTHFQYKMRHSQWIKEKRLQGGN